ncbi:MAG TPA: polyhydroxyalkanoate synthesis regulator DNA-binding domain-containing protein [Thermoanaerobaculia bacterium]|nr:polyhydroxyalkanoate synthesis regulator DNA-binding domain-containing protein [Thermoanaerobaculia bacterium]
MIRLIKRYESRKLYDTEESRYVSLEEIASWVRQGQEVRVLDNATAGDVTSQTLTQIILDEGRRGTSSLPSELLHELVRLGERAVHSGVEQVQHGVDRLVQASIDRLAPVRRAREEMSGLRTRLEQLEESLAALDSEVLVGLAEAPGSDTSAGSVAAAAGGPGPGDKSAGNGAAGAASETTAPATADRAHGADSAHRPRRSL